MLTYTDGIRGTTATLLDDAKTAEELYEQMKKLGFPSSDELLCRTGVLKLYKRTWQARKRTFEYDYCCEFVITGLIQLVLLPELSDVIHFLREVDAQPLHSVVSLDGVSQTMMACIDAWVKRLEEPAVHLKEVDAFTIVLEQIATALQQLVPSSLPTHIQPNGLSTGHAQSSTETKETL